MHFQAEHSITLSRKLNTKRISAFYVLRYAIIIANRLLHNIVHITCCIYHWSFLYAVRPAGHIYIWLWIEWPRTEHWLLFIQSSFPYRKTNPYWMRLMEVRQTELTFGAKNLERFGRNKLGSEGVEDGRDGLPVLAKKYRLCALLVNTFTPPSPNTPKFLFYSCLLF